MSKKLDNQYLNLAGAPWTPTNPSQGITLANYFAAAATTLCIGGAAALSPHLSGKEASALASEAALVTMASAFYCARVRRRQAQNISKKADHLVINTSARHIHTTDIAKNINRSGEVQRLSRRRGFRLLSDINDAAGHPDLCCYDFYGTKGLYRTHGSIWFHDDDLQRRTCKTTPVPENCRFGMGYL